MNIILCVSSLFHSAVILLSSFTKYNVLGRMLPVVYITGIGCITSIANHATTSVAIAKADRMTMVASSGIYLFHIWRNISPPKHKKDITCIVIQTCVMYGMAKLVACGYCATAIHLFVHINADYLYWRMLRAA